MANLYGKKYIMNTNWIRSLLGLSLLLLLLAGCTPITRPAEPVAPAAARISGRVLWAGEPVADATVDLRSGAWATAAAEVLARTVADANGEYTLENPPVGEYGLVAGWPDGGANRAAVTPVQITAGAELTGVDLYLARELDLIEPASGATVATTPTLRWQPFPAADHYCVWVIDAGTTELMVDQLVSTTSLTVTEPLNQDTTYTWLVQALTADERLLAELENTFYTK
jgi:hypothetical protein